MTSNGWEDAFRPTDRNGGQYHIQCGKEDVARYYLLPGDPKQVGEIARMWDSSHLVVDCREYATYTGKIGNMDISACSTRAGDGSTVSTLKDLTKVDCDTLIHVGTCGAIQTYIKPGDLIICTGAVRKEGTNDGYATNSYPAVTDHEVIMALIKVAEQLGYIYHMRTGYTVSSFFYGQRRLGHNGYNQNFMKTLLPDMWATGVLNSEMEATIVLTIGSLYKMRAGAIFTVVANRVENSFQYGSSTVDHSLEVASLVMQLLWEWDKEEKERGKVHISPSLTKQYVVESYLPR